MDKQTRLDYFKEVSNKKGVGLFVKMCRPISNEMKIKTKKRRQCQKISQKFLAMKSGEHGNW